MLDNCWNGLIQHALDGWNIGPVAYGYLADRQIRRPRSGRGHVAVVSRDRGGSGTARSTRAFVYMVGARRARGG